MALQNLEIAHLEQSKYHYLSECEKQIEKIVMRLPNKPNLKLRSNPLLALI